MTGSRILREQIISLLPLARRYARALTGTQDAGDALVKNALTSLLASAAPPASPRIALYRAVTESYAADAQAPGLAPIGRQLLLLTALEGLSPSEAALVAGISLAEAEHELENARSIVRGAVATDILIIEDEPVIALDIEELVQSCGHNVVGVASSESEAIAIAARQPPGLILADINLGRGGDGSRAVAAIQATQRVPVIFVTAYPERLLTGTEAEPTFILTKPFDPMALAIATYQAVSAGKIV